jgi:hypothetical protein
MKKISLTIAAAAAAMVLGSVPVLADQTNGSQPAHHSLFSFLHKPKPATGDVSHHQSTMSAHPTSWGLKGGHSAMGQHSSMFAGAYIGNKKTHVFHVPGGKSALPAPANRVYFKSAAQAIAAGYHQAKN